MIDPYRLFRFNSLQNAHLCWPRFAYSSGRALVDIVRKRDIVASNYDVECNAALGTWSITPLLPKKKTELHPPALQSSCRVVSVMKVGLSSYNLKGVAEPDRQNRRKLYYRASLAVLH